MSSAEAIRCCPRHGSRRVNCVFQTTLDSVGEENPHLLSASTQTWTSPLAEFGAHIWRLVSCCKRALIPWLCFDARCSLFTPAAGSQVLLHLATSTSP